ncbi:MAG: DUF1674 domain-containing protein, partial [Proteobacteria bacterium]|nr:DUF1674 domain-containing protein [Pseudomonadota bacterium]
MTLFKRKVKPVSAGEPAEAAQIGAPKAANKSADGVAPAAPDPNTAAPEVGGRKGPEPTRYGDWENKGRCVD